VADYNPKPLIGYQLTKQIEQKAKETSKKKADAESRLSAAEQLLEHCKSVNADVASIEKNIGLVVAALDGKDFDLALEKSDKAVELSKRIFIERINAISGSAEEIAKIIKDIGEEPQQLKQLITDLKQAIKDEDFDSAVRLAEQTYDTSQKALHEQYAKIYSRAQQIVLKAKELGENVESLQRDLQNTKEMIESEDYTTAITTVKTTLEAASDLLKTRVVSDIDSIEDGVLSAEDLGADVSKLKEYIARSRDLVGSMDFDEAMSYARRAQSECEKAVSGKIHDETRKLREDARTTKKHGGETDDVLSMVDVAAKHIKDHEIGEASRNLEKARTALKEVQFKIVLKSISKSKDSFVLAKKLGVDISKAVTLLNQSRDNLQKGQFEEAIDASDQAEKEIDNSLQAFRHAQERVESLSAKVKSIEAFDLVLPEEFTFFDDARQALGDRDFVAAAESAATGLDMFDKFLKKAAQDKVTSAEQSIAAAARMDADIEEAKELLESAKENLAEQNLGQAYKQAMESIELASAASREDIDDTIDSLEAFIDECSKSFDVVEYITGMEKVKELVAASKFPEAMAKINAIKTGLGNRGADECRRLIGESEMRLGDLEAAGIDAADLHLMLSKANEFFKQGMLDKAVATAKEAMDDANLALEDLSKKTLIKIKSDIESAQSDNIDTTKWRGLYKQSKENYESADFSGSYQISKRILDEMSRSMKERTAVMMRIKKCEDLLADAAKSKIDISEPAKMIETAKASMNKLDIKGVAALVAEAEYGIESTMGMFLTAKMIMLLKSSLEFASKEEVDTGQAAKLLEESKSLMKDRKHENALVSAKRAQAELAKMFKTRAQAEIVRVRGLIEDAKNVGADVSRPEKLLDNSQAELDSNDFETGLKSALLAKSEIEQIKDLSSKSSLEIKIAKEHIRDAEAIGLDMAEPRGLLQQAVEALANNKYAISYEFSKKISAYSTEVIQNNLDKLLGRLSKRMQAAEKNGINIDRTEALLGEAGKAYSSGDYQGAIKFIQQCELELDQTTLQLAVAANSLQVATKRISDAEKDIIVLSKAKKMLEEAQGAMKKKRFTEVIGLSISIGDEVDRAWRQMDDCRLAVNTLDDRLARLDRVGLDIPAIVALKKEADRALQNAEYTSCREICVEAERKISVELDGILSSKLKHAGDLIDMGKMLGFDDKECPELLAVAQTSAKEGLWDFAYEQTDKCCKKIESTLSEQMQAALSNMLAKMSALQKAGASVKSVEDNLEAIEGMMGSCDYLKAYQMLIEADTALTNIEVLHKGYIDAKYDADSAIAAAKKFGLPVKESEDMVAEAEAMSDEEYSAAIDLLKNAGESARSGMEKFNPDISIQIKPVQLNRDQSGSVNVDITNKGKSLAKDLRLEFQGGLLVESLPEVPVLKPGESKSVEIKVSPKQAGEFDITITVAAKRLFDGKDFEFAAKSRAKVAGKEPGARIARAIEPAICSSCNGKIKPGFDIAICKSCQSVEHLPCAKRTKKCGSCGAALEF
jgi:hypothetical protein